MGKALEWIGADGCAATAEQLLTVTQRRAGEIWAACPFHQEGTPGNAFSYSPERDQAYCNSCGTKGDLISIFGAVNGLDASQAFAEFRARYAPNAKGASPVPLRTPRGRTSSVSTTVAAAQTHLPSDLWQQKARALVDHAHAELLTNPAQMNWLAERGISRLSVVRHRLGWIAQDLYRARESWGLPESLKEDGTPKKLWIPAGLTIPCFDGETVQRVRVRRPDGEPKYYVLPGSAQDPAPLLCIPDTWGGHNHACVAIEAELDAILVAQEVGDVVSVMAVGSATVLPKDDRSVAFVKGMAWVGLWLDRDQAGHKGVARWTERMDGEKQDGGYAAAIGVLTQDIRPQGAGKMDPGDCHKAGMSIREYILSVLPRGWKPRTAVSTFTPGEGREGAAPASRRQEEEVSESVRRMGKIMAHCPLMAVVSDDVISLKAMKRLGDGRVVPDPHWELAHWDLMRQADALFWHDKDVFGWIEAHPAAATGVHGRNYWAPMARKGE